MQESVIGCDRGHYLRTLALILSWKRLQLPTAPNKELLSRKGDTASLSGGACLPKTSFLFMDHLRPSCAPVYNRWATSQTNYYQQKTSHLLRGRGKAPNILPWEFVRIGGKFLYTQKVGREGGRWRWRERERGRVFQAVKCTCQFKVCVNLLGLNYTTPQAKNSSKKPDFQQGCLYGAKSGQAIQIRSI